MEVRIVGVLFDSYFRKLPHNVGMIGGYVVVLVKIGGEIVEVGSALFDNQFPVAFAHPDLVGLVKFPIEEVVFALFAGTQKSGDERYAVEIIDRF